MPNDSFDLSALETFDLDGLSKKGSVPAGESPNGKPLIVAIEEIIEDPAQPRTEANPGFSKESIQEMADSILAQGIKMPISVKPKNADGLYLINDGARRFRGAQVAGQKTVPVIIDENFNRVAQLMVNLQREGNTPDEIAQAIAELEAENISRADIARGMGKNKGFVSEYAKFASISPVIRSVYDNGDCKDVKVCNQLDDLLKEHPEKVQAFITSGVSINRRTVGDLSKQLKEPAQAQPGSRTDAAPADHSIVIGPVTGSAMATSWKTEMPDDEANPSNANSQPDSTPESKQASNEATPVGESAQQVNDNDNGSDAWPFTPPAGTDAVETDGVTVSKSDGNKETDAAPNKAAPVKNLKAAPKIIGAVDNRAVRLVIERKADDGYCWVEFDDADRQKQVLCSDFTLVNIEVS